MRPPRSLCDSWLMWVLGISSSRKIDASLQRPEPLTDEESQYIIGSALDELHRDARKMKR